VHLRDGANLAGLRFYIADEIPDVVEHCHFRLAPVGGDLLEFGHVLF
jgi:hypothetical protein